MYSNNIGSDTTTVTFEVDHEHQVILHATHQYLPPKIGEFLRVQVLSIYNADGDYEPKYVIDREYEYKDTSNLTTISCAISDDIMISIRSGVVGHRCGDKH